jgi:hypothetical protein
MIDSCFALLCVYYSKLGILGQPEKCSTLLVETMSLMVNTEKEKHTMFDTILRQFTQLFTPNYQSRLEQYISAHRPTSVAEVEHLERQYSKSQHGGLV